MSNSLADWLGTCFARQDRVLVTHKDLSVRGPGLSATSSVSIHRQSRVRINRSGHTFTLCMQSNELLVRHLVDLVHLGLSISRDEFLDDHETTTYTDDQLAVEDLCIDLLRAEQEETVSNFSNGNWTVRLVDVVAQHLIQQVTLWKLEHRSLLLITDLHVHYLDDLVLVFEESLHFLDLINLLGNTLGKIIKSLQQNLLILSESLDVRIQSLDVSVQVRDL